MKRLMMSLVLMVTIVASAAAMSFSKARKEALFLSDKMAYELNLSLSQYEAVYEINLDYMLGLNDRSDLDGVFWMRRNADLRYVLSPWQWDRYTQIVDFYRPMLWVSRHNFSLSLRTRYVDHKFFYYERPSIYGSYRGGHNAGHQSYYEGRDFHRPETNVGPRHYGSSAPQGYGSGRSGGKGQPSYTPNEPSRGGGSGSHHGANPAGSQSGSVRGRASSGNPQSSSTIGQGSGSSTRSSSTTSGGSTRGSGSTQGGGRGGR